MSSVQLLIDQKAALEIEIARAVKAAEEKKKALEAEIAKRRADEIAQGKAEIAKLMQQYNLRPEEVFGPAAASAKAGGVAGKRSGYLSEIRQYYKGAGN